MSNSETAIGTVTVKTKTAIGDTTDQRKVDLVTIENAVGKIKVSLGLTLKLPADFEMARIDVGIEVPISSNSPEEIEATYARAKAWVEKNVQREAEKVMK